MAYHFELPIFTQLTDNQRLALEEKDAIGLTGGPGTGKTVTSLWRHIMNYELHNKKSLLLTYTKSLEFYLKRTAAKKDEDASNNIDRTLRWTNNPKHGYDEIIIDEAQDVELNIYKKLKGYTSQLSYGADDAQSLYHPASSTVDELSSLFEGNEEYDLTDNFRNSKEILQFTKKLFPTIHISQEFINSAPSKGREPYTEVLGWDNFEEKVVDEIIGITEDFPEPTHNIGVLLPSQEQVKQYYNMLKDKIDCSKYFSDLEDFETLKRVHITTYKSAKGLEFDTVILPGFDSYQWFINNTSTFSQNDYYVALTRAKLNLYLLCKNGM